MASPNQPLVSIIIRARNEERALKRLLPILTRQKTEFDFEIWILDNESQDGTAAVAQTFAACLHTIPRRSFNYASALNLGAQLARGSIVVNLSAHCFPQSDSWLAHLVEPLRRHDDIIATYGRQWVDPQQNPYEAEGNDIFFPAQGEPQFITFSNANAAIRRAVILQYPFNPYVKILEDHLFYLEMSPRALFEYVPEALVQHEHDSFSLGYYLKRWPLEGWAFHFILKQRGLASPFKTQRFFDPGALRGYLGLGRKLYRTGHRRAGLAAFPFFLLREALWVYGWLLAKTAYLRTARGDRDFLYKIFASKGLTETPTSPRFIEDHSGTDTSQWPEEWQLKADWPYIRQNVADFIRGCYESDAVFQSPLLEIGASGQNDYLGERHELITSNLAYNRQNTAIPLDMEDMADFADNSIGSILCSEVIEHVKHPDRALAEAFRVLKPGGKLVLTTPYAIVIHNTPEDGGFHGRNFTPQGLELGLVEAGFKIHTLETRGTTLTRKRLLPTNIFAIAEKPG